MPSATAGRRQDNFHVTRPEAKKAIQKQGFHGKPRTADEGFGGDFFGAGTYVHTEKSHSDEYLHGVRSVVWGDEVRINTQTKLRNPFKISATNRETSPTKVISDAMVKAGHARPGERLAGPEITRRLKAAGHDGVELKQAGFNHDLAGSQIVVFDPKNIRVRPAKKNLLKTVNGRKAIPKTPPTG